MLIVPKKFLNMQEIGVLDSIPGPIAQELNPWLVISDVKMLWKCAWKWSVQAYSDIIVT